MQKLSSNEDSLLYKSQSDIEISVDDQEAQRVQGKLSASKFEVAYEEEVDNRTREIQRTLYCYTLQSKNEDISYVHSFWDGTPAEHLRVFPSGRRNYLAWINGTQVSLEKVTSPRDRENALIGYLSGQVRKKCRYHLDVRRAIDGKLFFGVSPFHFDIEVLSLTTDDAGRPRRLVVKLPNNTYKLVREDNEWKESE